MLYNHSVNENNSPNMKKHSRGRTHSFYMKQMRSKSGILGKLMSMQRHVCWRKKEESAW